MISDFGADAYFEARRKEDEASSDAIAKDWGQIALAVARKVSKRVDVENDNQHNDRRQEKEAADNRRLYEMSDSFHGSSSSTLLASRDQLGEQPERLWRSGIAQSDVHDRALAPCVHREAAALKDPLHRKVVREDLRHQFAQACLASDRRDAPTRSPSPWPDIRR